MRLSSTVLIPVHLYLTYNYPNTLTKFLCSSFFSSIKDSVIWNFCSFIGMASTTSFAPTYNPGSMDMELPAGLLRALLTFTCSSLRSRKWSEKEHINYKKYTNGVPPGGSFKKSKCSFVYYSLLKLQYKFH